MPGQRPGRRLAEALRPRADPGAGSCWPGAGHAAGQHRPQPLVAAAVIQPHLWTGHSADRMPRGHPALRPSGGLAASGSRGAGISRSRCWHHGREQCYGGLVGAGLALQRILAGAYAGLLIPCCLALRCLLSEGAQNQKQPKAWDLKASFRPFLELKYALFSVCLLLYIATSMIPFTHLVFYARDELHYDNAAGLMSLTGLGSMVGRLSCGVLAVWIPARWIFPALFLLQGCVLLWLPFCEPWQLPSFSMIYGVSSGVRIALVTLVVAELFGAHRVQPLFCLLGIPMGFGLLAGPPLAGMVFDLSGSYQAAFFGSGAAMIALLPLLGLILFLHKNAAPGGPGPESADDQGVIDKPKDSEGPQENVLSC